MDGSVGQTTSPVISDGPFLRSGPSGQVWNVTGKIKKDTYYWLVEAGPIEDWPSLQAEEKEVWKWQGPQEEQ